MKDPTSTTPPERIAPAADALIETLQAEAEALEDLEDLLDRQLEALQAGDPEALAQTTTKTQDRAAALDELRQKGQRQMRLLSRVLDVDTSNASLEDLIHALEDRPNLTAGQRMIEVRAAVERRAEAVNHRGETVGFALQYAAELNHDLLVAMQEATTEADGRTYTATGETHAASGDRSLVNTIG